MKSEKKNIWLRALIIGITCFFVIGTLSFSEIFTLLENRTYDSRMKRTAAFVPRCDDIIFISVDQESIDWAQKEMGWGWPWPRSAYADIIDFISAGNVNSIGFDVIFSEPSVYGEEDDLRFAEAEKNSGKVIQAVYLDENENGIGSVLFPLSVIGENAASIANVTSKKDSDDIIRRVRLSFPYKGETYPTLGFAPLFLQNRDMSKIPVLDDNTVLLRYQNTTNIYNPYRASDVLRSAYAWKKGEESPFYNPEDFDNFYVFLGYYAPGLFDICSTPVSQVFPGVGVHITAIDNYLNDAFVKKLSNPIQLLWIFVMCLFGAFSVAFAENRRSQSKIAFIMILGFAVGLFISFLIPFLVFIPGLWLKIIPALFGFMTTYIISLGFSYALEGRQKRFIKSAFSQYLSPIVIDQLIAEPDKLRLGGERREISIYFSDIEGFTSVSENIPPEKLIEILNKYLSEMSDIILNAGGTIDKYEGDAIVAFWNAPLEIEDHGLRAISAAMECQKRLAVLGNEFEKMCGRKLHQRIGINTGTAVVGNMGSKNRFDYTMIGDNVNLASRLEGLNKQFGTYTLCTEAAKNEAIRCGAVFGWRRIAKVAVVGKTASVLVYEPMSLELFEAKKSIYNTFDKGFVLFYEGKFLEALSYFEENEKKDPVSEKYAEKTRFYISNPPSKWKGIWVATEK